MSWLYLQTSKKIADAKLAKDFQAVLKEFQKAQRLSAERETAYTPFVPQALLPSRWLINCYWSVGICQLVIIDLI